MLDAIDKLDPRPSRIVLPCPGCYRSFHENYPHEGVDIKAEVVHITEFLNEIMESGKLVVKKKLEGNVFYHDPCDLGRHSGIYEPPRKLLSHFADVKEFPYNRDKAHCCGGGGGLQSTNYDITLGIGVNRVMEGIELEADIIVSACPGCKGTLSVAAQELKKETGKKVKVMDIVEIVAKYTTVPE
jgi:Fe-S oxidoreductase